MDLPNSTHRKRLIITRLENFNNNKDISSDINRNLNEPDEYFKNNNLVFGKLTD